MTASAAAEPSPPWPPAQDKECTGIVAYSERVFGHLPRSDQRRWAATYLCGLLRTPGRKTAGRMARHLALSGSAPQALQQFITASAWDCTASRVELARIVSALLPGAVWTVGLVRLRKRGTHSVGLRRRVLTETGQRVDCQVGVGLFLGDGHHSIPVSWRLLLDDAWCGDPERRRRARIPADVTFRPEWALALEMLDELTASGVATTAPLVYRLSHADSACHLVDYLARRDRDFVLEVAPDQPLSAVLPGGAPRAGAPGLPSSAAAVAQADRPAATSTRPGEPQLSMTEVLLSATDPSATANQQTQRLVAEHTGNPRFWITSTHRAGPGTVRALAHHSTVTDAAVRRIHEELGLLDFEGRSFPGWHHHMTLASAAYLYHHPAVPLAPDRM
nr:transposase [Streptomyces sp. NBRC 109706]